MPAPKGLFRAGLESGRDIDKGDLVKIAGDFLHREYEISVRNVNLGGGLTRSFPRK